MAHQTRLSSLENVCAKSQSQAVGRQLTSNLSSARALPNLKRLVFGDVFGGSNNIGDEGMKALAEAVSKGALDTAPAKACIPTSPI